MRLAILMPQAEFDIVEQYNKLLRDEEDITVKRLNRLLDSSFNRLVRRTRVHLQRGNKPDAAERNISLLQEFRKLIPAVNPNKVDAYDRTFERLVGNSSRAGLSVASEMLNSMSPGKPRIDVSIPLEAVIAAAKQSHGYLRKHGEKFAVTASDLVAQGIAEGRPTSSMIHDMRERLGVVKSRGECIVRTESLRAYNSASNDYYANQGIDSVLYYATADDRACPTCAPRGGKVYERSSIRVPLHPRCRCYLAPWDADVARIDPAYRDTGERHRKEMEEAVTIEPVNLNKPGAFEQIVPTPISA